MYDDVMYKKFIPKVWRKYDDNKDRWEGFCINVTKINFTWKIKKFIKKWKKFDFFRFFFKFVAQHMKTTLWVLREKNLKKNMRAKKMRWEVGEEVWKFDEYVEERRTVSRRTSTGAAGK